MFWVISCYVPPHELHALFINRFLVDIKPFSAILRVLSPHTQHFHYYTKENVNLCIKKSPQQWNTSYSKSIICIYSYLEFIHIPQSIATDAYTFICAAHTTWTIDLTFEIMVVNNNKATKLIIWKFKHQRQYAKLMSKKISFFLTTNDFFLQSPSGEMCTPF